MGVPVLKMTPYPRDGHAVGDAELEPIYWRRSRGGMRVGGILGFGGASSAFAVGMLPRYRNEVAAGHLVLPPALQCVVTRAVA